MSTQNYRLIPVEICDEEEDMKELRMLSALMGMDLVLKYRVLYGTTSKQKEEKHQIFRHSSTSDYRVWWGFPYFLETDHLITAEIWGKRRIESYNKLSTSDEDQKFEFISCIDVTEVKIDLS